MIINLNVKIKAGKRTPVEVIVYGTAANEKILHFANGREVTESQIAAWITQELTKVLKGTQDTPRVEKTKWREIE